MASRIGGWGQPDHAKIEELKLESTKKKPIGPNKLSYRDTVPWREHPSWRSRWASMSEEYERQRREE